MLKAWFNYVRNNKKGFTLIELLIVVAIIAILAAIAIPQFSAYRRRGYNASALSDCRNIRTTEEAMFADFQDYGVSGASGDVPPKDNGAEGTVSITLIGGNTGTANQTVALSPKVYAVAEAAPTNDSHTNYLTKTGHSTGDQFYGADSSTTNVYRKGYATAGLYTAGELKALAPTTSTSGATDFAVADNWNSM